MTATRSYAEEYLDLCGLLRNAVVAILAVIAKDEGVRRSERALVAVAKLRQGNTEHLGRSKLVVDRDAVRRMAADGMSLRAIAEETGISAASAMRIVRATAAGR